ncbi:MAG: hypothetical protein ACI9UK_001096 [Candidatus Krumholzibacteriia bacterium]|jgi:hypothetical protein
MSFRQIPVLKAALIAAGAYSIIQAIFVIGRPEAWHYLAIGGAFGGFGIGVVAAQIWNGILLPLISSNHAPTKIRIRNAVSITVIYIMLFSLFMGINDGYSFTQAFLLGAIYASAGSIAMAAFGWLHNLVVKFRTRAR